MHTFTLPTSELSSIKRIYIKAKTLHTGIYDDDVWSSILAFHFMMKNRLHQNYPAVMFFSSILVNSAVLSVDPRSCIAYKGYDDHVCHVYRELDGEVCFMHTAEQYIDIKATIALALNKFKEDIVQIVRGPRQASDIGLEHDDFYIRFSRKYWAVSKDSTPHVRHGLGKFDPLTVHDFYIKTSLGDLQKAIEILKGKREESIRPNNPIEIAEADTIRKEFISLVDAITEIGDARPNEDVFDYNYVVKTLKESYPDLHERLEKIMSLQEKFADFPVVVKFTIASAYSHSIWK